MRRSLLEQSFFDSACKLVLSASRLEPAPGALSTTRFQGSSQLIENNVFIGSNADALLLLITGSSGSAFRFNTVINRSSVVGSGTTIACNDGLDVTSNIVAYNSTAPFSCAARYTLFDAAGAQQAGEGVGNRSADSASFFRDRQEGDFHLRANSPAIGFGEPGLTSIDLEGNMRPVPAGSRPDVGAFEAP